MDFSMMQLATPLFIVLAILLVLLSVIITPGKRAKVIERLGKPRRRARMAGLSFRIPLIDWVVGTVNLQLQEIGENVAVKTQDNAFMTLPVKVQFRASSDPEGAVRAHYELEDPERQIISYVLNNVKNTVSSMPMEDLYGNRDAIEKQVQAALREQFEQYGYTIANVLVDEPQPSDEVRDSFNRVIASEREKEAATNIAEAKRIQLVGVATAEKQSKKLQGEGIANMRDAIAEGLEKAMEKLTSVMSRDQALMLLMDTNRLDTIGSASTHGNVILMDVAGGGESFAEMLAAIRAANTPHEKDHNAGDSAGEPEAEVHEGAHDAA